MKLNILFLTMTRFSSLQERGIYTDLLQQFRDNDHDVFVVSPNESRLKKASSLTEKDGIFTLSVRTPKLQKSNLIEKGIGQISLDYLYLRNIRKYWSDIKFDLILYSTPPITFSRVIKFIKKRDQAYSYLLLKDIFPQNAVDMKMMKKNGFLYNYFRRKESELYSLSDTIGCMSQANVDYILRNNPNVNSEKIEVNPNSIAPVGNWAEESEKKKIREKYLLPQDKKIFIYGGNLGVPQGIDFLLETIENVKTPEAFFLIVGSGTEYNRIEKWFKQFKPGNARLMTSLPKKDFDLLLSVCHIGLIFLHKDFTIPNFPSRLLSYLEMKMPVIAATDPNTDMGEIISRAKCGDWVEAGNIGGMVETINKLCSSSPGELKILGENGYSLIQEEFHVIKSYYLICSKILSFSTSDLAIKPRGIPVNITGLKKVESPLFY